MSCPHMRRVDISYTAVGDPGVAWLGDATGGLVDVCVDGLAELTESGWRALVERNASLVRVSLVGCAMVGDAGLTRMGQHMRSLVDVSCGFAPSGALAAGWWAGGRVIGAVRLHVTLMFVCVCARAYGNACCS